MGYQFTSLEQVAKQIEYHMKIMAREPAICLMDKFYLANITVMMQFIEEAEKEYGEELTPIIQRLVKGLSSQASVIWNSRQTLYDLYQLICEADRISVTLCSDPDRILTKTDL